MDGMDDMDKVGNATRESSIPSNPDERLPLADKVILVAGGTGGLGAVSVEWLLREGAWVVAGFHKDAERARRLRESLEDRHGARLRLVRGDIRGESVRADYVKTADELGGGLYGLVCFTGDPARGALETLTADDLLDSMTRNFIGPILLARDAAGAMRRRGGGAIVLISTMQAVAVFESSLAYASAKAALTYSARILAKQWGGPQGIRVNVVAPGVNEAGMALKSIESGKYDSFLEQKTIPRFGRAKDIARVVRLLLEPDNYITGQVITVDGGLTLRRDRG
jgi:NAD(P)-dependent dehydrogenase (short-subunit alcohol dehydrogenase family)